MEARAYIFSKCDKVIVIFRVAFLSYGRFTMRILLLVLALIFLYPPAGIAGEKVVLVSLEWPPYTGEDLQAQGATSAIVRAAFKAAGYDLEIRFLPWNRAMESARLDEDIDGYFPEYPDIQRNSEFLCSNSVGKSPIGFAKRQESSFQWQDHTDLTEHLVGVVSGYVNSAKFDVMVKSGMIQVETSVSDVLNLRKVMANRVDLAVVDTNVYHYILEHDSMLYSLHHELRLDPRLLSTNDLIVCFSPGTRGEELQRRFNLGLKTINPQLMQKDFIHYINHDLKK